MVLHTFIFTFTLATVRAGFCMHNQTDKEKTKGSR